MRLGALLLDRRELCVLASSSSHECAQRVKVLSNVFQSLRVNINNTKIVSSTLIKRGAEAHDAEAALMFKASKDTALQGQS